MEKIILLQKILNYLSRLNDLVVISNKAGETIVSKTAEGLIRELFNIMYSYDLRNCNLDISNYPAIDLHNEEKRICFQITSNKDVKKIIDTYEIFFKRRLHIKYDNLFFVLLGNINYDLSKLEVRYSKLLQKYNVKHDVNFQETILDLNSIYSVITNVCGTDEIIKIKELLEKNFDLIRGVNDLTPYYNNLKKNFFDTVMDDVSGLTLNAIYVEPDFTIHESSVSSDNSLYNGGFHNYFELRDSFSLHDFFNSKLRGNNTYGQFFNNPNSKLLFVLGYPGQGKTSFCQKLLFDLLTSPRNKSVFYLKLRNVTDTKKLIDNPLNVIYEELEHEVEGLQKSLLKNSITILDGLDELYMKDNLNSNDIEIFCKGIIRECEKFSNWNVIITTRHGYVNFEKLYKEDYIALALKPLSINQQMDWLEKYRLFHPDSWLTRQRLISFNNQQNSYIGELLNQPLLMYIIASLEREITVNTDRAEIYSKLFDQIIERKYSKDSQIDNLKSLTKEDLRALLREIAYQIHKSGKGFITTKELLNDPSVIEYTSKIGNNNLSGTLKGILISFYFKERRETGQNQNDAGIEFFHKSLQEYLTAEKIVNDVFAEFLLKDTKNRFVLKKEGDSLAFFNSIFSIKEFTTEIWDFIKALVQKQKHQDRILLKERLIENIHFFFEKDFLYKMEADEYRPYYKIIVGFNSYWALLESLSQFENFITSKEICKKLISYYRAMYGFSEYQFTPINLSYQRLTDTDLSNISFYENNFRVTNFYKCGFGQTMFQESDFHDCSFFKCEFFGASFLGGEMRDVVFNECEFYKLELYIDSCKNVVFKKCSFGGGDIFFKKLRKNTLKFENVVFSEEVYDSIKGYLDHFSFKNCKIRTYTNTSNKFKQPRIIDEDIFLYKP